MGGKLFRLTYLPTYWRAYTDLPGGSVGGWHRAPGQRKLCDFGALILPHIHLRIRGQ